MVDFCLQHDNYFEVDVSSGMSLSYKSSVSSDMSFLAV